MTNDIKVIYGLILAGGFSRRMGQDKAALEFHGKPQVMHGYELLSHFCEKVFVSLRPDQQYYNLPIIVDLNKFENIGPIGGILSAMERFPKVAWIVLACDLPYVNQQTLQYLISRRDASKMATAFKSSLNNLPEPLCAIWEPSAKVSMLNQLENGKNCPRKVLMNADCHLIDLPQAHWLNNVNAPTDLEDFKKETFS